MTKSQYFKSLLIKVVTDDKELDELDKKMKSIPSQFKESLSSSLNKAINNFAPNLKRVFSDPVTAVIKEMKAAFEEMSEAATYNYGRSLFQTKESRNLALSYGVTGGQAYGMTKAKELLGLSEDDLFWMNTRQREKFGELVDKYTKLYDEWEKSGLFEDIEEYTLEFAEFKQELMMDVAKWFVDNKEVVKTSLVVMTESLKTIASAVSMILSLFSRNSYVPVSDIISNYQYGGNTTVNQTNNFNGVSSADKTWLTNVGEMTYQQLIASLGGR